MPVALALAAGILAGRGAWWPGLLAAGIAAGGAAAAHPRGRLGLATLAVCWFCIGAVRLHAWEAHPDQALAARLPAEPSPVRLHAIVVTDPAGALDPAEPARQACVLSLRHVRELAGWVPARGRVRALIDQPREPLRYGDELLLEGEWSRVPAPGTPGQFDWQAMLARARIHGLLRARPHHGIARLAAKQGDPVLDGVTLVRRRWEAVLRARFPDPEAGLLISMLLGQRVALDDRLRQEFLETGTIHLLVISGFNVGLIACLLEGIGRLAGLPWRLRLALSAVGVGGYSLLTGLQPPVARAMVMAWIVLGAQALDRPVDGRNAVAAAALVLLLADPAQLGDAGFQLSFGAVVSLLVTLQPASAWLAARLAWIRPGWLRRYLSINLGATTAVWLGMGPLLAWHFHIATPVMFVANVLIAPLIAVLVMAGTAALAAGAAGDIAVRLTGGWLLLLVRLTVLSVRWCAWVPGGHWIVGQPGLLLTAAYYGCLGLWLAQRRRSPRPAAARCAAAGLAVCAALLLCGRWPARGRLRLDALDVGHGDSLVVRTPAGRVLVVDAGTEEAGRFRLVPFLAWHGVRAVDLLVLTHGDGDHLGGALPLLAAMPARRVLTNGALGDTMSARRVMGRIRARGRTAEPVAAGWRWDDGAGLMVTALHPPSGLVPGVPADANDNSLVLQLAYGSCRMLLTGDIEEAGLPWLLQASPDALRSDVLKVPHHGSRLGLAGARLFQAVRPRLAVLSVGRAHHLPAPDTEAALALVGATVLSTREHGTIHLESDGRHIRISTARPSHAPREIPCSRE